MRQHMPIAIGRGMDRATGLVNVAPQYPSDARNVYARDAKMAVRPGMAGSGYEALTWGTDLLAVVGVKATHEVLFVLFDRGTLEIRVYQLNPSVGTVQVLTAPANGTWGTLNANADFPVVSSDESDGFVFFAHDENDYALRLPTIYYTPNFADTALPGTLTTLQADLNGDGVTAPVYFRGVHAHLEYMTGWGYGTENAGEEDAGNTWRFSQPGAPTTWRGSGYVLCGVRKEPIIAGQWVQGLLALAKENQTWIIDGQAGAEFTPRLLDSKYGAVSSRCFGTDGTRSFLWAINGPRQVTAQGTAPIGQALELLSPLPNDLAPAGPSRLCFAFFDPIRYIIEWCFPDIEGAYTPVLSFALSLWNPADPRWTFFERNQPVTCAGIVYQDSTGEAPTPPLGYVDTVLVVDP